jgi:hypothetical protein
MAVPVEALANGVPDSGWRYVESIERDNLRCLGVV